MPSVRMVMFDLAGTTIRDENCVAQCLYRAAQDTGIDCSLEELSRNIGTNKRDLYRLMIHRARGGVAVLNDLGQIAVSDAEALQADQAFVTYERYMLEHYSTHLEEIPGASDVFRWLKSRGIKVATDTGFHRDINDVIMQGTGWLRDGLVDVSLCVSDIPGERGRPAPFMIFKAMMELGITSVHQVVKVGDQPADMLEGYHAGCLATVGVLSGPVDAATLGVHRHTHLIPSVAQLPQLFMDEAWA